MANHTHERKKRLTQRLWEEQGGRCHWCNKRVKAVKATFDHIIPRVYGGPLSHANGLMACRHCNNTRGHRVPDDLYSDSAHNGWAKAHPHEAWAQYAQTERTIVRTA